jgi:hypothetical protein
MKNHRTLYVAGTFDDGGGKPSGVGRKIFEGMELKDGRSVNYVNGGHFDDLRNLTKQAKNYDLVFWFPHVSNDKQKLARRLKRENHALVQVTSKNNLDEEYGFADLVYHALKNKSNLFVEFGRGNGNYTGRVIDPLGNVFLDHSEDLSLLGKVLGARADDLVSYSRESSRKLGEGIMPNCDGWFLEVVKGYADVFHELIHPDSDRENNRFIGNASFRCESGFPSYRENDLIFVSQRNVDKRSLNSGSFVAVSKDLPLGYYGNVKPSVDTPVQVRLYDHYPGVNFMLHSHTYIDGAPLSENVVPCGALEEVDEITKLFPGRESVDFSLNLKGHGSLVLAGDVGFLEGIPYVARPIPELQIKYWENSIKYLEDSK